MHFDVGTYCTSPVRGEIFVERAYPKMIQAPLGAIYPLIFMDVDLSWVIGFRPVGAINWRATLDIAPGT